MARLPVLLVARQPDLIAFSFQDGRVQLERARFDRNLVCTELLRCSDHIGERAILPFGAR
jgi:hypothetical protein